MDGSPLAEDAEAGHLERRDWQSQNHHHHGPWAGKIILLLIKRDVCRGRLWYLTAYAYRPGSCAQDPDDVKVLMVAATEHEREHFRSKESCVMVGTRRRNAPVLRKQFCRTLQRQIFLLRWAQLVLRERHSRTSTASRDTILLTMLVSLRMRKQVSRP